MTCEERFDMKKGNLKNIRKYILLYSGIAFISTLVIPSVLINVIGYDNLSKYNIYISTFLQFFLFFTTGTLILWKKQEKIKFSIKYSLKMAPTIFCKGFVVFLTSRIAIDGIKWIYIGLTDDFSFINVEVGMDNYTFASAVVFLAAIPALCEELYYRVVAYSFLRHSNDATIKILTTAIFCLAHIGAGGESMLSSLILGAVLIQCFISTQDYFSVVFMHFTFNFLALFFTYKVFWITDCAYISSRAASGNECLSWGLIYVAIAILLIAISLTIEMVTKKDR